jgi:hypothetical protein
LIVWLLTVWLLTVVGDGDGVGKERADIVCFRGAACTSRSPILRDSARA